MMNTNPPLPDYLDVDAARIEERYFVYEGDSGYYPLREAAALLSGSKVGRAGRIVPASEDEAHACIARWAGEDGNRWRTVELMLRALIDWPDRKASWQFDTAGSAYAFCTATPTQLYRALVNVAWDQWRTNYNKQREAAEVTG